MKLNLKKRVTPPFYQKRNYPRVLIDDQIRCLNEGIDAVKVFDFNYVCVTVEDDGMPKDLRLAVSDDIILECRFENEIRKGLHLYNVVNYKELVDRKKMRSELLDWLVIHCGKREEAEGEAAKADSGKKEDFSEIGLLG